MDGGVRRIHKASIHGLPPGKAIQRNSQKPCGLTDFHRWSFFQSLIWASLLKRKMPLPCALPAVRPHNSRRHRWQLTISWWRMNAGACVRDHARCLTSSLITDRLHDPNGAGVILELLDKEPIVRRQNVPVSRRGRALLSRVRAGRDHAAPNVTVP